jgi:NADPH-dependent ferric siderophore reductase
VTERQKRIPTGIRRPPPPFRVVAVREVRAITPYLTRVTFEGEELENLTPEAPAASVRLLLPPSGTNELVMPGWTGNEFLSPDGSRPTIRTFTPLDVTEISIALEIVLHDGGATSAWAGRTEPGDPAAISGPGRGHEIDTTAAAYVLAGDETALPAIGQLIGAVPSGVPIETIVEVRHPDALIERTSRDDESSRWVVAAPDGPPGVALLEALRNTEIPARTHVWAAGEAGAMQQLRRHLADERGLGRSQTTVRGYWKHGR